MRQIQALRFQGISLGKSLQHALWFGRKSISCKTLLLSGGIELVIDETLHQEIFENCADRNEFGEVWSIKPFPEDVHVV